MKKALALVLAVLMCCGLMAACTSPAAPSSAPADASTPADPASTPAEAAAPVDLRVVSSFSGTDGNRQAFEDAYKAWEAATGNTVIDESQTSDESWKAKVLADFETGSEPDVLFFFANNDSNSFIEAGKVVSIEDIRAEYPDYAANMNDASLPTSSVDGKAYAIPTTGFWEGLFFNEAVLADCGLTAPGPDTTWDEFLAMCEAIKAKNYTPIAVSLAEVPHYWFEFCIMNNGGPGAAHMVAPAAEGDASFASWAGGLNDIAELYQKGYLPANTLSATDAETFQLMYDGDAAFAIDGSWKVGQIMENVGDRLDDYGVTFVPGKGSRVATDIVGGLSMGYFITKKAWDDPAKREAAVSFVSALTTDEVVNTMAAGTAQTALKAKAEKPADLNSLQLKAFDMMMGATSVTAAVQDYISPEAKTQILVTDTKLVANGDVSAEDAVKNMIAANG